MPLRSLCKFVWASLLCLMVLMMAAGGLGGCAGPLARSMEQELREQMLYSHRQSVDAARGDEFKLKRQPSAVETDLTEKQRIEELNEMAGPEAYRDQPLDIGRDLMGQDESDTVVLSLQRAVQLAVRHNPDLEIARVVPAINETQITQAEAVFDAVFFSNLDYQKLDTPQPDTMFEGFGSVQSDTRRLQTGIRKVISTGGQISLSTQFDRQEREPSIFDVNKFNTANVLISLQQPLLRNFGADVTRAQVMLAKTARQTSVQDLRQRMLDVLAATEQAYWDLVLARQRLLIQARLVQRTIGDREVVKGRIGFDAGEPELTQANSFVQSRTADLIRAQQDVRLASDALKRLMNAPDLPLSSETVILPADDPVDISIHFDLLDAITTALQHRPTLQAALLQIKDATIRQRVADNQRLPRLDLVASTQFNGVGITGVDDAYESLGEGDFIDYILSLQFEVPIGNRGPEALFRQRQLEKRAAVVNYQRISQNVILEVKDAMHSLITAYRLLDATRGARLASANDLRVLELTIKTEGLQPALVDRKLRASGTLADAERQEIQALTDYNTAIANFYRALGTLLQRNGIEFDDPQDEKWEASEDIFDSPRWRSSFEQAE